ncbi:hypothetical protein BGZ73_005636 [Actinomortierella ambigua]|nr:hypothetical protein BGZ73_005636 [Actinomortierella ambigua]
MGNIAFTSYSAQEATSHARLPYFHKKLTKNNPSRQPATAATVTTTDTPQSDKEPTSSSAAKDKHTTASNDAQPSISNRQTFRSIVPDPQIMREIREQGLGENAQYWRFEGGGTNKTIRPWDKKLTPEEYKAQQRAKRLPPRQVWFDAETTKVIEKQEVQFPTMRFVAGAATVQSIPNETTLLRLARPYLFEELDGIDQLLKGPEAGGLAQGKDSKRDNGHSDAEFLRQAIVPPTPEQVQQWRTKKRELEAKLGGKVLKEIAVVGRSNVGKSTLLNALTGSPNTARVSNKPGLTRQFNFYKCGTGFALVDMPGYGFAFANETDKKTWSELIETYVTKRKTLKRIYVMIDARHGLKVADRDFMDLLDKGSTKFQVVLTKCDLVTPPDLARRYTTVLEELKKLYRNAVRDRLIMVSSYTGAGMNNLRKDILWSCNLDILARDREKPTGALGR